MIRCSFCGHDNEDGLPFCDQCKTDLTVLAPAVLASAETSEDEMPVSLATVKSDPEVPTLHFDKIPLVETLGSRATDAGELTPRSPLSIPVRAPHGTAPATLPEDVAGSGSASAPAGGAPLDNSVQGVKPHLLVIRGEKVDVQYTIYPGKNYLGRNDDKPVDIDLESQEPADRIWTSRQHAVISFENGLLTIEDLNSLNGTFVNRMRVHPGQVRALQANDTVQVGTVQLRVIVG
jgi:FHA domain